MRIAIISDIHSNIEALTEVLKVIERSRVDRVVSLGDVVGYGASPNPCCDLVRTHADRGEIGATCGIPRRRQAHALAMAGARASDRRSARDRLVASGAVRPVPRERFFAVVGDLLYGTILTNLLSGRPTDPGAQTDDILDVILNGLLTGRKGAP